MKIKEVLLFVSFACVGSLMAGMSIEEWCQTLRDQDAAIRRGDWQQAAIYSAKASAGATVTGFIPVNYVNNCLVGVLCDWNFEGIEKRAENCKVLQACVDVCENKIAKGCGARLAEFLKKMKAGELDGIKFTANDMLSSVGLVEYLLEEPRSAADANHAKKMAHLNALIRQTEAATDVYRKEGEWHATQAKFAASMEYQQKHHKTFDPNNRPPKDSASREDWDSCKRIYDIFKASSARSSSPNGNPVSVVRQSTKRKLSENVLEQLKSRNKRELRAGDVRTVNLTGGVSMEMVYCPPGSFVMGSPESEADRLDNETLHNVTLTHGFWIGKYEVTQKLWEGVMGNNPSWIKGAHLPVGAVSWNDCQKFIRKINAATDLHFSLPTEAQWEYACRAGTTTPFGFGSSLNGTQASCDGSQPYGTTQKGPKKADPTRVGSYAPNAWGICDMHGNAFEWCGDWYDTGYYRQSPVNDPSGPSSGVKRVCRGGFWCVGASQCRSAFRFSADPSDISLMHGFRVICPAD